MNPHLAFPHTCRPVIDLKAALPYPLTLPLAHAGWDELIKSIKRSDLGATGVFFMLMDDGDRLENPGVLVLKRVADLNSALYEGAFPTMLSLKLFGIKARM